MCAQEQLASIATRARAPAHNAAASTTYAQATLTLMGRSSGAFDKASSAWPADAHLRHLSEIPASSQTTYARMLCTAR